MDVSVPAEIRILVHRIQGLILLLGIHQNAAENHFFYAANNFNPADQAHVPLSNSMLDLLRGVPLDSPALHRQKVQQLGEAVNPTGDCHISASLLSGLEPQPNFGLHQPDSVLPPQRRLFGILFLPGVPGDVP